jgi:hypothetical protein
MKRTLLVYLLSSFFLSACAGAAGSSFSPSSSFSFPSFTVDFYNETTLLYSSNVIQGGSAVYKGVTPTKESNDPSFRYVFSGWDKKLDNIQSDFVTHALYKSEEVSYTVTFRNYDGSPLEVDTVRGGGEVVYHSLTPTRPSDNRVATYTFKGWDKETTDVRSDLFVDALYEESIASHEVTFLNDDGTFIAKKSCYYGESVEAPLCYKKATSSEKAYRFKGWDGEVSNVTEERTLHATYEEVPFTDYLSFIEEGEGYLVSQVKDYPAVGSVILPDSYLGKNVVGVADKGFFLNPYLQDLTLGDKTLSLGVESFSGTSLSSVLLDDSLTTIGKKAFLSVPLKSIVLPPALTSLAQNAFLGCEDLSSFSLKNNNAFVIENDLLLDKEKTTAYLFPHDVEKENAVIPEGVTLIADGAFENAKIKNPLQIPSTITRIGVTSFFGYKGSLDFEKDTALQTIADGAFGYCEIQSLSLPEGVQNIGASAFAHSKLHSIALPSTLLSMQGHYFEPFLDCQELESISVASSNPVFSSQDGVLFEKEAKRLICYPANKMDTSYTLPEGTLGIGQRSCNGLRHLTSFTLADSLEEIQSYAFWEADELNYNVYKGARYLGSADNPTFALINPDTEHLSFLDMAPSCVLVAASAFHDADFPGYSDELRGISFSSSLRYINDVAFTGCPLLSSLNLPEGLKVLNEAAFSNCPLLKDVYLPDSLEKFEGAVFGQDPLLGPSLVENGFSFLGNPYNPRVYLWKAAPEQYNASSVTIPEGVRTIDPNIYGMSETLESIAFPKSLRSLSFGSFCYAIFLRSVSFQEGLLSLGESCFESSSLTSIALPLSLIEVGANCFNDCESLTTLSFKAPSLPKRCSSSYLGDREGLVQVSFGA